MLKLDHEAFLLIFFFLFLMHLIYTCSFIKYGALIMCQAFSRYLVYTHIQQQSFMFPLGLEDTDSLTIPEIKLLMCCSI